MIYFFKSITAGHVHNSCLNYLLKLFYYFLKNLITYLIIIALISC